jgi:spoIIIJ-associated protein
MEEIKKIIENIFKSMGLKEPEIEIKKDNTLKDKEMINVNLDMDSRDAECFIGDNSEGLNALQHIVRLMLVRNGMAQFFTTIDINGYKESKKNELMEMAMDIAKKVRRTKEAVTLEPMSAFERRIIHLKLAEQPDIVTESIGEEPERKVVIRLYP